MHEQGDRAGAAESSARAGAGGTLPLGGVLDAILAGEHAAATGIATALRTYNALTVVLSPNLQSAYMASTAGTVAIPTTLSTTS